MRLRRQKILNVWLGMAASLGYAVTDMLARESSCRPLVQHIFTPWPCRKRLSALQLLATMLYRIVVDFFKMNDIFKSYYQG